MTTFERFERSIPELMTELAPARVPDYFDDMLRETASHGQRPAWSYPERWLPMDTTLRPLTMRSFSWRPLVVIALMALLIAGALVAYVGSQPKLPPPFGAAGNGVLLYRDPAGAILSVDPATGATTTLAGSAEGLGEPIPSRNGQRIAFIPQLSTLASIVIADIDGTNRSTLPAKYQAIEDVDWSPDDTQLAFVSYVAGAAAITVAATDGSDSTTLSVGRDVWQMRFLPDGRIAFVAGSEPGDACPGDDANQARCALFVVGADGTGLQRVIAAPRFNALGLHPSPDGRIVYVEWSADVDGRLRIADPLRGTDMVVPLVGMPPAYSINRATFSPDGSSILFDLFERDSEHWAVVDADGGGVMRIGPAWTGGTEAFWAPDGRSVLARYETGGTATELWLLDATGTAASRRLDVDVPTLPAWQRVAP
jgi:Tol biopolymer transport system component